MSNKVKKGIHWAYMYLQKLHMTQNKPMTPKVRP